ncbi:MAG: T9SS type A sorting domain-containing protein [Bacteroidia bacterium]
MKTLRIFTIIYSTFIFAGKLFSQSPIDTAFDISEFDKANVISFDSIKSAVFGSLDTTDMKFKILFNIADGQSKTKNFTGGVGDSTSTYEDLYIAYNQIKNDNLRERSFKSWYLLDSIGLVNYSNDRTIPLCLFYFNYDFFDSTAFILNRLAIENSYSVKDVFPRDSTPYDSSRVVIFRPFFDNINNLSLTFKLSEDYIFTNSNNNFDSLLVDFGDGNGFIPILKNQSVNINYTTYGDKIIITKIYLAGVEFYSKSIFKLNSDPTTASLDEHFTDFFPDQLHEIISVGPGGQGYVFGEWGVWLGCGNDRIRKPIIISSGFDPFNFKKILTSVRGAPLYDSYNGVDLINFSNNGNNLLQKLRAEGYDIIILDYSNGTDYIQNNAALLQTLIYLVNATLVANGSKYEAVVMGWSSGALNARFSLTNMERLHNSNPSTYPNHHSWKYVSFDGEHQGANVPLGTENFFGDIVTHGPQSMLLPLAPLAATLGYASLNNPQAEQLLYYHYTFSSGVPACHPLRTQFLADIYNLNPQTGGFPNQTRNIGLSQGSSIGTTITAIPTGSLLLHLKTQSLATPWGLKFRTLTEYFSVGGNSYYYTRNEEVRYSWWGNWQTNFVNDLSSNGAEALDNCQGSQTDFHHAAVKPPVIGNIPYFVMVNYNPSNECFNPSISGLDIRNGNINFATLGNHVVPLNFNIANQLFYDAPNVHQIGQHFGYPHLNPNLPDPKLYTPFDALYSTVSNEFHVNNPPWGTGNFLAYEEIAPFDLKLQNRVIGNTEPYKAAFEARNTITSGENVTYETPFNKYTVDQFGDVTFTAGDEIALLDGFEAKLGCEFEAFIRHYPCPPFGSDGLRTGDPTTNSSPDGNSNDEGNHDANDNPLFVLTIFPNPTSEKLSLNFKSPNEELFSAYLYNSSGELVRTFSNLKSNSDQVLDITGIDKGFYILRIMCNDEFQAEKVIIN